MDSRLGLERHPYRIAIGRQPQASASAAKGLALIGDDAKGALPRNVETYRGRVKRRVSPLEFEGFSDQVQQTLHRQKILRETLALVEVAHPHQLDEAQFDVSLQAKLEERQHVVAIHGSHWHHVDLELNPSSLCNCYTFQHGRKVTAPRDLFELERVKGIQADIQSSDTRSLYNVDFFRKLLRVSRQADVFEPECRRAPLGTHQILA